MRLYVGNINFKTTKQKLQELFEQFGTVSEATIILDRDTGLSKGFGFIEMPDQIEALDAIGQLNGKSFGGRDLTVGEAHPAERVNRGGGHRGLGRDRRPAAAVRE